MRKFILVILLAFSATLQAQNFQKLKQKADSFEVKNDYKLAAEFYDKCIDLVLSDQEHIRDLDWMDLLTRAIKVNSLNKSNTIRYVRLAYNTRAEKMPDKIELLNDMGIIHIFSFSVNDWIDEYIIDKSPYFCPDVFGKNVLVWEVNDNIFFQGFSPCITYKPLKINDKTLLDVLKHHSNDLINQKIGRMPTKHSEIPSHTFTFYSNGAIIKEMAADEADFIDINEQFRKYRGKQTVELAHQQYLTNTKTYFSTLFSRTLLECNNYFSVINSGYERSKLSEVK